jgi:dTDP-4-dehydrorhamnose 3,5-epimerase
VIYKCTDYYSPASERVIAWNDPALGIEWPLPAGTEPLLADRDRDAPRLDTASVFP